MTTDTSTWLDRTLDTLRMIRDPSGAVANLTPLPTAGNPLDRLRCFRRLLDALNYSFSSVQPAHEAGAAFAFLGSNDVCQAVTGLVVSVEAAIVGLLRTGVQDPDACCS